jgi:PAS domain S-box-containing protein
MIRPLSYIRCGIALLLLLSILSGAAVFAGNRSDTIPVLTSDEQAWLKSHGPIVFVSQSAYPPFEFRQKDGSMEGICIELARWMSTEMGIQVRFISMTFQEAQQAVLSSSADVLTSLFYSDKRAAVFNFSEPLFDVPASIFVKAERPDITRLEDLNGKRIAIQRGDYAKEFLESKGIPFELVPTDTFAQATDAVIAGNADVLIGDEQIVLYYLFSNRLTGQVKKVGTPLYVGKNCMATRKDNPVLSSILTKSLKHAKQAGVIDNINNKWLGTVATSRQGWLLRVMPYLLAVSLVGFVGTMLVVVWNRRLRQQVEVHTRELNDGKLELQKSNAQNRLLLDHSSDLIWNIDADGRFLYASPSWKRVTGYDPEEIVGTPFQLIVHRDDHPACLDYLQGVLSSKEIGVTPEYRTLHKDGSWHWHQATGMPVLGDDGVAISLVGISRDISERKQAEEDLCRAKTAAEAANQAKSEFLANMSHEIRTPMSGVLGMAELLSFTELTPQQEEYLACIKISGDNLLALINDILDLSKIEAGKVELEYADFSLRTALNDVVNTQISSIHKKQLQLQISLPDELPEIVRGDQLRFKQILLNLLSNALKFTDQGSIAISGSLLEQEQYHNRIRISISDTGIGMTLEQQQKIFAPFAQADSSTTRKFGGTGLGLTICRQLAELMGGEIIVTSSPGQGSSFQLELPFGVSSATAVKQSSEWPDKATAIWSGTPLTILVAEDNTMNLQCIVGLLTKLGIRSESACNGQEALIRWRRGGVDLILMDIQMPVMDGDKTLQKLRHEEQKENRHTPVIALTAHALRGDRERLLKIGFDGYLTKPLNLRALLAELHRVTSAA